jgi:hypothetical protein
LSHLGNALLKLSHLGPILKGRCRYENVLVVVTKMFCIYQPPNAHVRISGILLSNAMHGGMAVAVKKIYRPFSRPQQPLRCRANENNFITHRPFHLPTFTQCAFFYVRISRGFCC